MRVALVLGSGGARGYAHLGALQVLRERGHEVVAIAGTSMGALVGGLAAAGKDDEFAGWVGGLTYARVLRLMDPSLSGTGAVRGNKVLDRIHGFLGDVHIEELPIPFTAVATDLAANREVWFQKGPLLPAIRASIAIPGALTPVEMDGRLLVDGGLLNPLPMEPVLAVDADVTLAVDASAADTDRRGRSPVHEEADDATNSRNWLGRIGFSTLDRDWARRLRVETDRDVTAVPPGVPTPGSMDIMLRSFETMQSAMARFRTAANPPDILVPISYRTARNLDFHRAADLIALGRRLTEEALDGHAA